MHDYKIKYIGCIVVKTSMKSLDQTTRSEVAKESINRLCKTNNIGYRRSNLIAYNDYINGMLEEEPNLLHSGKQVQLCVTTNHLKLIAEETKQIIIQHEMPNVSYASRGDDEDFVAYVAKDATFGRACFVLECGPNTGRSVLQEIARGFQDRIQQILHNNNTLSKTSHARTVSAISNSLHLTDSQDISLNSPHKINNENECNESVVAATRESLEKEPWFHGSFLSREVSEGRLKHDGDFLVRESLLEPGHFVLSVMHNGTKLHLLFDSVKQVKTKEMVFNDIIHLIRYHHDEGHPIVAEDRIVYLRNGVRPI